MTQPVSNPVVLVVEDEMVLRMRAVDIVEDAGFVPVEAVSADEAIKILESRDDISLLFTDIQMPGSMDGLKLAHAAHTRWPHIKIILVSGQIAVTDEDKPDDSKFFPKPLQIQQMVLELQAMIGSGKLKVMPALIAADDPLTKENQELRYQLQQAGIDAKALLLKTVLDTEKQQLIINENPPFQDALTTETTVSNWRWSRRASTRTPSSFNRVSTPKSAKPPTNCSISFMRSCITASRTCSPRLAP